VELPTGLELIRATKVPLLEDVTAWVLICSTRLGDSPDEADSSGISRVLGVEGREFGREITLVKDFSMWSVENSPPDGPSSDHGSEMTCPCGKRRNPDIELEVKSTLELTEVAELWSRERALVT